MRILAKIGGASLEQPAARSEFATAVRRARDDGHEVLIVHGGGNQIRALTQRVGIEDRYYQGLRVTDADTADIALMVLGGQVNRELVAALETAGVPAVGLSGADGATFAANQHRPNGADLEYVGEVGAVDARLVRHLLAGGFTPVLASVAPLGSNAEGPRGHFYNINADHAAGPLAAAFDADAALFLSDVDGVLDAQHQRLECLTPAQCEALRADGVIHGGMLPKIDAALGALAAAPNTCVKIANGSGDDAVRRALSDRHGTRFAPPT